MEKMLFFLALGLIRFGPIAGQALSPSVFSSAGGVDKTPTLSLEWTLGELAVQSFDTKNGLQTEGFHQPMLKVEADRPAKKNELAALYDIQIKPNPVQSFLHVNISSDQTSDIQLKLMDLNGKTLLSQSLTFPFDFSALEMGAYPAGLYLLQFQQKDGYPIKTFKVSKIK